MVIGIRLCPSTRNTIYDLALNSATLNAANEAVEAEVTIPVDNVNSVVGVPITRLAAYAALLLLLEGLIDRIEADIRTVAEQRATGSGRNCRIPWDIEWEQLQIEPATSFFVVGALEEGIQDRPQLFHAALLE